jgi:hypothetical protein
MEVVINCDHLFYLTKLLVTLHANCNVYCNNLYVKRIFIWQ